MGKQANIMNTFIFEKYEFEDEVYHVITEPENDVAILRESDGYDVSLYSEIFDGILIEYRLIETDLDFDDYTHEYFINHHPTH